AEVDRAEPGCGVERDRRVADGDAEADRADAGVLRAGGDRAEQAAADAAPAVGGHDSHAQLRDVVGDVAQAGVLPAEPTQPRGTDRDLQPAGAAHVDGDDAEVALALPAGDVVRQRAVAQQLLAAELLLTAGPVDRLEQHVDEELGVLRPGVADTDRALPDLLGHRSHSDLAGLRDARVPTRTRRSPLARGLVAPVSPAPYRHVSSRWPPRP